LKSIAPFLQEDEVNGGPPYRKEMSKRLKWANEFEQGIGRVLQERLEGKLVFFSTRFLAQ
jgi:carnitine O-acetyltransferase